MSRFNGLFFATDLIVKRNYFFLNIFYLGISNLRNLTAVFAVFSLIAINAKADASFVMRKMLLFEWITGQQFFCGFDSICSHNVRVFVYSFII